MQNAARVQRKSLQACSEERERERDADADVKREIVNCRMRGILTGILDRCNDHLETVRVRAPAIGDIFQGHEIRSRIKCAHRLLRIPTSKIRLWA